MPCSVRAFDMALDLFDLGLEMRRQPGDGYPG
jgi:hypothetical protein